MPTVSVKLSDATREKVQSTAATLGLTPHALMVHAIEEALTQLEPRQSLVEKALIARERIAQTGLVVDGAALNAHLKAKVRGTSSQAPQAVGIEKIITKP